MVSLARVRASGHGRLRSRCPPPSKLLGPYPPQGRGRGGPGFGQFGGASAAAPPPSHASPSHAPPSHSPPSHSPRLCRRRRAPEAGGDFLCPPRPRPPGRRLRLSLAPPAAGSQTQAEGGGEGQAAPGREAPGRGPSRPGVSGAGLEGAAAGGTPGFPGRRVGARSPMGAGRRIGAASGLLPFPGVCPADILCPPLALSPRAHRSCQALRASAAVTRAQVTRWLPFSSLAHAPANGKPVLTSLPLLHFCLARIL